MYRLDGTILYRLGGTESPAAGTGSNGICPGGLLVAGTGVPGDPGPVT
jgi:hypothetical protein